MCADTHTFDRLIYEQCEQKEAITPPFSYVLNILLCSICSKRSAHASRFYCSSSYSVSVPLDIRIRKKGGQTLPQKHLADLNGS